MQRSYDVVIIGGGVIGSSVAYHLSANPDFTGRTAVIERDPTYAAPSSSLSTGAIRQQFGMPSTGSFWRYAGIGRQTVRPDCSARTSRAAAGP